MELIQYCKHPLEPRSIPSLQSTVDSVVVSLLPMLSIDRKRLSSLLIRSALCGSTQSSRAVYQSILALAAYHRGNDLVEVHRLKRAALRNLIIDNDPTICQGIQHVVANLLLCVLGVCSCHVYTSITLLTVSSYSNRPAVTLSVALTG
jgi:hypothetical protein